VKSTSKPHKDRKSLRSAVLEFAETLPDDKPKQTTIYIYDPRLYTLFGMVGILRGTDRSKLIQKAMESYARQKIASDAVWRDLWEKIDGPGEMEMWDGSDAPDGAAKAGS
jgi:hypothetical protein